MEREETVGFRVRTLSVSIKRAVDAAKQRQEAQNCTGTHGWVIGYLYDNRHRDVYQRDIEKHFSVRRPTMTAILQLMEKNGLLERTRDEKDARLKKIVLTPLALEIHQRHETGIEQFETLIRQGISDEDMKKFFEICEKLQQNVEKVEKEHIFGAVPEQEK